MTRATARKADPAAAKIDDVSNEALLSEALRGFSLLYAPGHLLRRNHQRSYDLFSAHVGEGVTRQQVALLIMLSQQPGASQNELVAQTAMDKSTLKEMLGRMAARGLVERKRDPDDNRSWSFMIAPAGRQLLIKVLPDVVAAQRDILAPLPQEQRQVFVRMLRVLVGLED